MPAQGRALPGYVEQEFEDYLKCGRLEHGFLRVRCDTCHAEHLVAFSCKRRSRQHDVRGILQVIVGGAGTLVEAPVTVPASAFPVAEPNAARSHRSVVAAGL